MTLFKKFNFMIFSTLILLGGCGHSPMFDAVKPLFNAQPKTGLNQNDIQKLTYASVSAKLGSAPEKTMMLSRVIGDQHIYFGMDKSFIILQHGQLIRAQGFGCDVTYANHAKSNLFKQGLHKLSSPVTTHYELDLNRDSLQYMPVESHLIPEATEKLMVHDKSYTLKRVREHVKIPALGWTYDNYYWVFPDNGWVMKARIVLHPSTSPLDITTLKFAGK